MTKLISKQIQYKRLENGVDTYLLKTSTRDVVTCMMAFPGGTRATYEKQSIAVLLAEMLPGGTKNKKRSAVLEKFDELGAHISVVSDTDNLLIKLSSTKVVFVEAYRLLIEVLASPLFMHDEYKISLLRLKNKFEQNNENTKVQAGTALKQLMYVHGHPHWVPDNKSIVKELNGLKKTELTNFYNNTFSTVGSFVCIAGDIQPKKMIQELDEIIKILPSEKTKNVSKLHVNYTNNSVEKDAIVTIKDKLNIDTVLGIPLSITREHSDFFALYMAISILGASSTSRLFNILRTEKSLTYGAYAILSGFEKGYPGFVYASAIFPNNVFNEGRNVMKKVVKDFVDKGVTSKELKERKVEMLGKFKVGLSSTVDKCSAVFSTIQSGKPVSYIDEYVNLVESLTLREVNNAIKEHLDYSLLKTASAGGIDKDGKPV